MNFCRPALPDEGGLGVRTPFCNSCVSPEAEQVRYRAGRKAKQFARRRFKNVKKIFLFCAVVRLVETLGGIVAHRTTIKSQRLDFRLKSSDFIQKVPLFIFIVCRSAARV